MESVDLKIKLLDIAEEYRGKIERSIREVISQPKYRNSGAGLASLVVEVVQMGDRDPVIQVTMDDHIFRLESRNLQWTQLPNMNKMLEWASHKTSDPKEIKKLAWSVAKDKQKNDTWKPKSWRRKALSSVLKEMNKQLLQEYTLVRQQELEKSAQGVQA